jgi:hypothetical protein
MNRKHFLSTVAAGSFFAGASTLFAGPRIIRSRTSNAVPPARSEPINIPQFKPGHQVVSFVFSERARSTFEQAQEFLLRDDIVRALPFVFFNGGRIKGLFKNGVPDFAKVKPAFGDFVICVGGDRECGGWNRGKFTWLSEDCFGHWKGLAEKYWLRHEFLGHSVGRLPDYHGNAGGLKHLFKSQLKPFPGSGFAYCSYENDEKRVLSKWEAVGWKNLGWVWAFGKFPVIAPLEHRWRFADGFGVMGCNGALQFTNPELAQIWMYAKKEKGVTDGCIKFVKKFAKA